MWPVRRLFQLALIQESLTTMHLANSKQRSQTTNSQVLSVGGHTGQSTFCFRKSVEFQMRLSLGYGEWCGGLYVVTINLGRLVCLRMSPQRRSTTEGTHLLFLSCSVNQGGADIGREIDAG